MSFNDTDIAIIGMNCRFPGIDGLDAFEACLRDGRDMLAPVVQELEGGGRRVILNATVPGLKAFDADRFGYTHQEARIADPQQRLFLETVWEMLEMAGYSPKHIQPTTGIFSGVSTSYYLLYHLLGHSSEVRNSSDLQVMIGNDKDHLTSQIAYRLDLTGPTVTVQASCATSLVATHLACESLNSGQCDLAISGGVSLRVPSQKDYDFQPGGLLSEDGAIHAFDANASGTVYSSGVATLLLKRAEDAVQDGDQIFALISGSAINNDGAQRVGYTAPAVNGQVRALMEAQEVADVNARDIAYIEAHGSGTPLGDRIELDALYEAFQQSNSATIEAGSCGLGSVKTNIGHCEMAAGAAGLIKTALSLKSGKLFPSLHFETPAQELMQDGSPFYVNDQLCDWPVDRPRIAGVSSFGLGGNNAHAILRAYDPSESTPQDMAEEQPELLVLSARNQDQFSTYERSLISAAGTLDRSDVAHTLRVGREADPFRKAVIWRQGQSIADALTHADVIASAEKQIVLLLSPDAALSDECVINLCRLMPEVLDQMPELVTEHSLKDYPNWTPERRIAFSTSVIFAFLDQLECTPAAVLFAGNKDDATALWSFLMRQVEERPCFYCNETGWVPVTGDSVFATISDVTQQLEITNPFILGFGSNGDVQTDQAFYHFEGQASYSDLISSFGQAWAHGVPVNWQNWPGTQNARRIRIPRPEFIRNDFWIEMPDVNSNVLESSSKDRSTQKLAEMDSQGVFDCVKETWEEVFGTELENEDANFFELGGHSLLAARLITLLQERLGVTVPMSAFFETPTVAGLASACQQQATQNKVFSPQEVVQEPDNLNKPFALTDVQLAYWVGRQSSLALGDVATHIYFEFDLPDFSHVQFEDAVNKVIARHPMLRAVIKEDGTQQILESVPRFTIEDIPADDWNSNAFQAATKRLRSKMSHQVTDCSQWPLFDIRAVTVDSGQARLHVSFDLLIADAWSIELFMREVSYLYRQPKIDLPALSFSFRDHVLTSKKAEESEAFQAAKSYWEERIPTLPMGPDLPLETAPASLTAPKFVRRTKVLDRPFVTRLQSLASQNALTMTGLMMSCFASVLARWSRDPHFCINLTLFNRPTVHPDILEVIGDFTTLNIMEIDFRGDGSFLDNAQKVQRQIWQDLDHRLFSGVQVSRRLTKRNGSAQESVIPVVFTSLLNQDSVDWADETNDTLGADNFYTISQTPQVWLDHQVMERDGCLYLNWDAVEELFDARILDEMFASYVALLEGLALDPTLLEAADLPRLPAVALPVAESALPVASLHDGLARYAVETPEAVAIWQADAKGGCAFEVSYDQLHRAANKVATVLRAGGLAREEFVAIIMDKGWEQSAAAHGILRAGGAYLPIDPEVPPQRRAELLAAAGVRQILTQPWHLGSLQRDLANRPGAVETPVLQALDISWQCHDAPFAEVVATPDQTAYVIFTSGSTGSPKGVVIAHQAVMNTIEDICVRRCLTSNDGVFGLSSLSFDLSVFDLFGTSARGARLVLPHPDGLKDPRHWGRVLRAAGVTVWNSVPALLRMLVAHEQDSEAAFPELRVAMLSGDWIPLSLPEQAWQSLNSDLQIISLGGATEASIWSIEYPIETVDPTWQSIPYGTGLTNQPMRVVGHRLDECPTGVIGEIVIAGVGLAKGYLGRPDLTEQSFVTHADTGERLYKTGDLGRYTETGLIEFLGRKDTQVKVNGYRIELGEIETILERHEKIRHAKAMVRDTGEGVSLVAFVETDEDTSTHKVDPTIITDPGARLAFKLEQRGIRRLKGERHAFGVPEDTDTRFVRRRSCRNYADQIVTKEQLGEVLRSLSQRHFDRLPFPKYRYGSAGGLYPVQTYVGVHSGKIQDVPAGLYYHDPRTNELVATGERSSGIVAGQAGPNVSLIESASFALYFVCDKSAIEPLYGKDLGVMFAAMEVGAMCQLLEDQAADLELGFCQLGAMNDRDLRRALDLGDGYMPLHCIVGGFVPADQHDEEALIRDFSSYEKQPKSDVADQDFGTELAEFLKDRLPNYMVPQRVVSCRRMPLTSNGKIDNKVLIDLLEDEQPSKEGTSAAREIATQEPARHQGIIKNANDADVEVLETKVIGWWTEALGGRNLRSQDSFFDAGGTSLELVRVHRLMEQELGAEIPIVDLFRLTTPHETALYLADLQSRSAEAEQLVQRSAETHQSVRPENPAKASRSALLTRRHNMSSAQMEDA
ncbi:Putative peptide synthetase [Pseudovibrio sp. FO-BEG1]|uniref:non-ribosomal peptide synthetase n=1 Tax=Pseudovibrio sp. (strain FO-BEG1) TaxID=911045 RepID=UPI000238C72E|nr:non-ribosomal peptide synthetase [Pseudovibrio sp. FO-BEG1]AEV37836.1 Putative peptide synthetase [Pseudovibrio sp. FO-BEG1]